MRSRSNQDSRKIPPRCAQRPLHDHIKIPSRSTSRSPSRTLPRSAQDPFKIPFKIPLHVSQSIFEQTRTESQTPYTYRMILALNKEHAHMVYAVTKPCECTQSGTCSIDLNVKPAFVNQLRRATGCSELPSNSVVRQKLHLRNYYLTSKRSRRAPQAASALYDMNSVVRHKLHLRKYNYLSPTCDTGCTMADATTRFLRFRIFATDCSVQFLRFRKALHRSRRRLTLTHPPQNNLSASSVLFRFALTALQRLRRVSDHRIPATGFQGSCRNEIWTVL